MNNKPEELTASDIDEIASMKNIQQIWHAENDDAMASLLRSTIYAVKFDFESADPGYRGDLYF
jgi:hypothetical protein